MTRKLEMVTLQLEGLDGASRNPKRSDGMNRRSRSQTHPLFLQGDELLFGFMDTKTRGSLRRLVPSTWPSSATLRQRSMSCLPSSRAKGRLRRSSGFVEVRTWTPEAAEAIGSLLGLP